MALVNILCLANSKKIQGRCLAGLTWPHLETWIRPVEPTSEHGEVPNHRAMVDTPEGRRFIRPLDVISVELREPVPAPAQPENWILGSTPITLVEVLEPAEVENRLRSVADNSTSVFGLGGSREIPESEASRGLPMSIALFEVDSLLFARDDRDKWRLNFRFNGVSHRRFPISDLELLDNLERRESSQVSDQRGWFLTISATEPFLGGRGPISRWLTIAAGIRIPLAVSGNGVRARAPSSNTPGDNKWVTCPNRNCGQRNLRTIVERPALDGKCWSCRRNL